MTARKECDLSPPVSAWLAAQGYTAYSEVCCGHVTVDLVGYAPDRPTIAVELKRSFTRKLLKQAMLNQLYVERSYAAVGTQPRERSLRVCRDQGVGVLSVGQDEIVLILESDSRTRHTNAAYSAQLRAAIAILEPGGLGGLPGGRVAWAQNVARAVVPLLRAKRPWSEIFQRVPNHYASAASMRNALWSWPKTRAILRTAFLESEPC